MSELIATGTAETDFSAGTFTVAAGSWKFLFIKGVPDSNGIIQCPPDAAQYELAQVTSGGNYNVLRTLTSQTFQKFGAIPAGSYAVRRIDTGAESGMDITG